MSSKEPAYEALVAAAQQKYEDEGTLEIDDSATIVRGSDNDGAYVQAWVWVYYADMEENEDDQPNISR